MTWFRAGGGGIPASLKNGMNAVLNKKFGTSGQTYAPSAWPDDVNLLGKLPEKTVSGAVANIKDGADEVPLKELIFSASPVQATGTPSPSNPLPISGHMEMNGVHTGKNLMIPPTYTTNTDSLCLDLGCNRTFSSITLSFLATNSEVDNVSSAIVDYREEDGTHHYKTLNDFRDENNVPFSASASNSGKYKNTYSNITFRYVYISYQSTGRSKFATDSLSDFQLEVGSSASTYAPFSAETKKWSFPPFGKNLANLETFVYGYVLADGTFVSNHGQGEKRSDFIKVKPNTTYTFKVVKTTGTEQPWIGVGRYTASNTSAFITRQTFYNNVEASFTTESNCEYVVVSARNLVEATEIQLEEGSQATAYEPYQSMFAGYVNALTGKIIVTHKCVDLGSNDITWTQASVGTGVTGYRFRGTLTGMKLNSSSSNVPNLYCDSIAVGSPDNTWNGVQSITVDTSASRFLAYVTDFAEYTAEQFKNAVKGMLAVYELATPIEIDMDSVDWQTQLGDNNFFNDCGDTSCTYRADIDLALAQLSGTRGLMMASRSVSPMIGEEASLDRENILEEVSENLDNEESEEER